MKIIVLLYSFIIAKAAENIFDLNGWSYAQDQINSYYINQHPNRLQIDYSTNYLYFTDYIEAYELNVITDVSNPILGITNITALALDQVAHVVYIGTTDGIYKYYVKQRRTDKNKVVGTEGKSILNIYFNEGLYYSDNSQNFYTLLDGNSSQIIEIDHRDTFVIDNEDDMFVLSGNILYRQKKETKEVIPYKGAPVGRGIAADKDGNIYYCTDDGIYEVMKDKAIVKQKFSIYTPLCLTFDRENNMIYSDDSGNIYRLISYLEPKQQFESIGKKIDNVAQKIDKRVTSILEGRLQSTESFPRNINLVIKDINITISSSTPEQVP